MDALLTWPQEALLGLIGALDAMPDGARAALSALLLVLFLRLFERRIPGHEIQYGQSFRKAALAALLVIPLFVYLVPASRMTVFVDELVPTGSDAGLVWLLLLGVWLTGVAIAFGVFLREVLTARRECTQFTTIEDGKLTARVAHWCRRLGVETDVALVETPGAAPRFLLPGNRIALPAAALHWPGNLQDIVLITALVHLKRRHRRWQLIGRFISCLYWPIPWVQTLAGNLLRDFERAADELAASCYRDPIGYERALRQLSQRLAPPAGSMGTTGSPVHSGNAAERFIARGRTYAHNLARLLESQPEPPWNLEALLDARKGEDKLAWTDPYDKVVLFVGQAVFFAFLLTGATLKERPPEIDYEYSMPFELFWKEHFHRNLELQERVQPPPGA